MSNPRCFAASRVDDHHAAAGRFASSERSSHLDRFAGDDRGRGVTDVHAVGVHHPRHDLIVGVDVGRRDVLFGADRVDDLRDVPPRQRLELAARHPRRIADDPSLAAAERHVRHRALPGHPRGERGDLVERNVRVIADPALRRTERDVVLHAVSGEHFDLAVVHLDRAGDGDLTLGCVRIFQIPGSRPNSRAAPSNSWSIALKMLPPGSM